jgi:hypothetical protein
MFPQFQSIICPLYSPQSQVTLSGERKKIRFILILITILIIHIDYNCCLLNIPQQRFAASSAVHSDRRRVAARVEDISRQGKAVKVKNIKEMKDERSFLWLIKQQHLNRM